MDALKINQANEFKPIDINDICNEIIKNRASMYGYERLNTLLNMLIDNVNKNVEKNEYIINYRYIITMYNYQSVPSYAGTQIIIITNFASVYTENGIVNKGKCELSYDIQKMINIFFNIICGAEYDTICEDLNIGKNIRLPQSIRFGDPQPIDNRYIMLVKVINYYLNEPLIEIQEVINENSKLKKENEIMIELYKEMKKENEETKQQRIKLDNDMKKYKNIQNLEKKYEKIF